MLMIPMTKNLFLGKYLAKVATYHCEDSIEGKCVAAVAELIIIIIIIIIINLFILKW